MITKGYDLVESEYLDENKKFRKGNPGGGRPPNPKPEEHEPVVEELWQGWVDEFCELAEVESFEELSPTVKTLLRNAKKMQLDVEIISAKKNRSANDQKLLSALGGRVNNALMEAHNLIRKQLAIKKERGKGKKKRVF